MAACLLVIFVSVRTVMYDSYSDITCTIAKETNGHQVNADRCNPIQQSHIPSTTESEMICKAGLMLKVNFEQFALELDC